MADAEDLKSSGDFSSCGFDSHPGHHSFLLKMNELLGISFPRTSGVPTLRKNKRIAAPGVIDFGPTRRFNYLIPRYPDLAELRAMLEGWSAKHSWSGRHFLMTASKEKGSTNFRLISGNTMCPSNSMRLSGVPCANYFLRGWRSRRFSVGWRSFGWSMANQG